MTGHVMMLRLVGGQAADLAAATDAIEQLVGEWDGDVRVERASVTDVPAGVHDGVDPVAVAALVLAIPSAVLAVIDITDRIRKRRRAKKLIERSREIHVTHRVEIYVETSTGLRALTEMEADHLLELASPPDGDD